MNGDLCIIFFTSNIRFDVGGGTLEIVVLSPVLGGGNHLTSVISELTNEMCCE